MVKSVNTERLIAALKDTVDKRKDGGPRLTVSKIAKTAQISRATANRDKTFITAFKHAVSTAAAADARIPRRGNSGDKRLVSELRRTINDMANVIQALSLALAKLEAETSSLRVRGGPPRPDSSGTTRRSTP